MRRHAKRMRRLANIGRPGHDVLGGKLAGGVAVESQSDQRSGTSAQFRLDVSVSPGNAHEFDLWRFGLSSLVDLDIRDPDARASFAVNMTSWQFADVAISFGASSAATFDRSEQTIARSGLDHISILAYLVDGSVEIDGRETDLMAGDIFFFDLTRRCTIRVPDYKCISLILPREMLTPLVPNLDNLHGYILRKSRPLNHMLFSHLQNLYAEASALDLHDARTAVRATASLIATLAHAITNGRAAAGPNTSFASLHALRRVVDANLANPDLRPEFLCQQLAMSRASLYRLFEPLGGVRRYIQQRRLTRAYQSITDPSHAGDRIGTIAARYGFSNDSVFSRAFRETFGMSPSDLRDAWRGSNSANFDHSKESDFVTMNRWLLGLETAGR